MRPEECEEWLHQLAEAQEGAEEAGARPGEGAPTLDELARYRAGELSPAEAEAVERGLLVSGEARWHLAQLGGVSRPVPPSRVRRAVLDGLKASPAPARVPSRARWWAAAASLVFALAGSCLLLPRITRGPASPLPEYEVSVRGLAAQRGEAVIGAPVEGTVVDAVAVSAYPSTRLVLDVTSLGSSLEDDAELGLYRRQRQELARVKPGEGLTVEAGSGAWRVSGITDRLVGDEPGDHSLWLVVARPGALPGERVLLAGRRPEVALGAADRRVLGVTVRVIAAPTEKFDESPGGRK